jgi:hypothetical protein
MRFFDKAFAADVPELNLEKKDNTEKKLVLAFDRAICSLEEHAIDLNQKLDDTLVRACRGDTEGIKEMAGLESELAEVDVQIAGLKARKAKAFSEVKETAKK